MENIILSGMLREFSSRQGIGDEGVDKQFEKFSNYCLLKTDHYDSFDFEKVETGHCIGIDGLAISIGGVLVDDIEEAKAFTSTQFDVKFSFCQAKTSAKFNLGDFLKFIATIKLFFGSDLNAIPDEIKRYYDIKELIYERSAKLRLLPTVEISYFYTGAFSLDSKDVLAIINEQVESIKNIPYKFSAVTWQVCDGDRIAKLYREALNDVQRDVAFQRHVALPEISGARATYIGVMKCRDYVSLIQKENGEINKGLFFENVRDFLGENNPVNEEIAETINSNDERDRFAILNNGVTVVARSVVPSGDKFRISRFQVVNGCQTSHVLFKYKNVLTENMYLTVKLIETSDVDLSGKIIATTNSQSQVTKEAFATIRPYHRGLEDFFDAMRAAGHKYYYERRPHQFDDVGGINQNAIVSAPSLIKSFVSVVLEEPHKVHYYYGRLLQEYNSNKSSELFSDEDYPGLYFAAHHIVARVRSGLPRNGVGHSMKNWIFHLALLVKKALAPELSKGGKITDKKFMEIIERIDAGFDAALSDAIISVQQAKLSANKNRVPDATRSIADIWIKSRKSSITKEAGKGAAAVKPKSLPDGRYVGVIHALPKGGVGLMVKYGPFLVEAGFDPAAFAEIKEGARVSFVVDNGKAEAKLAWLSGT